MALALKVLEATDTPAAAFGAALLGDFGAEVTVVEPPGGSAIRRLGSAAVQEVWWPIIGRNKRSLALDVQRPSAQAVLAAAVREADILLVDDSEQGRAVQEIAAAAQLGGQLTRVFAPGADLPASWRGSTRPEFAACATGLVALTGAQDGPPLQPEFPLADATSGTMAALLALVELRHGRLADQRPQRVDLGLHETLLRMNEWQLPVASVQGHAEPRCGNRFPMNWSIANLYPTRDGRFVTISAATASVAERLMRLVGGEALCSDPRFATPQGRRANMDALDAVIAQWMHAHDAEEVLRLAQEVDVVAGLILDTADLLRNEQVLARGDIVRIADATGRRIAMPAPLPRIDALPGAVRHPGPRPGDGATALLARLGMGAQQVQALREEGALWALEGQPAHASTPPSRKNAASGASVGAPSPDSAGPRPARRPLEGLRVLEAGIVIAGPFAGSLLAELGAEVIKVEQPGAGDPARQMGVRAADIPLWWGISARAKRCIALDLKSDADRQVFLSLARESDVLLENYRPGVLDRLGLGWDILKDINPRLVMLSVSGYGSTGPYAGRPGFGRIAEAFSGIVQLCGTPDGEAMNMGLSVADTTTGLMGAFGVALALLQRDVFGGGGARIDLALFESLFRMCECQLALHERIGRPPCREGTNDPYGWGASGRKATLRAMRCADRHWVMVDVRSVPAGETEEGVAAWVAAMAVQDALDRLQGLGIAAAQVHDAATLAASTYFARRGDVVQTVVESIGAIAVPGEIPKRSHDRCIPLFRAPRVDEDRAVKDRGLAG
ncbi:CoA transferase [Pseudorhodoferax sp.]|uniref:CaiB/BaiF CoA-transferase family protein n=1 Tax=Pseudorhodoferax sp. TaxID=1993553 RepID=UPI0039E5D3CD